MKKVVAISAITFALFLIEFVLANTLGRWFKPNLLILLVIFIDLHWGSRWGVFVAILSGLFKDCIGAGFFGVNICSFILCVYVTTLTRRYLLYDVEFGFLRILMAFLMSLFNVLVAYILNSLFYTIDFSQALIFVVLPEVLMTTLVAAFVFKELKKCVLKFSA